MNVAIYEIPAWPARMQWRLAWIISELSISKYLKEQIFQILTDLNIPYELQEHKAIFSEEDSKDVVITLEGTDVKNLFVKDKNNNYGLVSLDLHKRADLKKIAAAFGYGRLCFCPLVLSMCPILKKHHNKRHSKRVTKTATLIDAFSGWCGIWNL